MKKSMNILNLTPAARREAWLRISAILTHISKAEKTPEKKFIDLERKLASELIKQWRETYNEALREIFKSIPDFVSQETIEFIQNSLLDALGASFGSSKSIREQINKFITKAYSYAKNEWIKTTLSLPDKRAINILSRHNCFWLGEHYGKHIGPKIAELTQKALDEGMGRYDLAEELRQTLGSAAPQGYTYWDIVASSALVRARSFGAISGMEEAGITEYEILAMNDERMCPICGEMNGKHFSVAETRRIIDKALDLTDPEEFKAAMPWHTQPPTDKSEAQLTADGQSLPPFHGRCRCTLVMVDSYDLNESGGQGIINLTGALNDDNDPNMTRRVAHAERYYETLRNSESESIIKKLSKNGGISLKSAQKVYEHILINKYELDEGVKRFDASYDMAVSLQRLLEGKNIQAHDLILLRHERLEYELMNRYKKDYRTAHNLTNLKHNYDSALRKWQREADK